MDNIPTGEVHFTSPKNKVGQSKNIYMGGLVWEEHLMGIQETRTYIP